jgi:AraC-like DNA-binding protein
MPKVKSNNAKRLSGQNKANFMPLGNIRKGKRDGDSGLQVWRLQRVVVYIEAHLADNVTLLELSKVAGFSPMHFAGQFRTATGQRPHDYVLRRKIEESQVRLLTTDTPIVDIALGFGFLSQSHFTTVFKRFIGFTPLRWQHFRRRQIQSAFFRLRKLQSRDSVESSLDTAFP